MSEIQELRWYVVHTYSGHENKVKATIEKAVKTRGMEAFIKQVVVPTTEDVIETTETEATKTDTTVEVEATEENVVVEETTKKKDKKAKKAKQPKPRKRKIYPSYVFIQMIQTDETWYIVRNTKGVTGFVGPGSKPVPLSDEEVESMGLQFQDLNQTDIEVGDTVKVCEGSFKGQIGTVKEIDIKNEIAKICVDNNSNMSLEVGLKSIERI